MAFSVGCHDREAIAWIASTRGLDGEMVRDLIAFGDLSTVEKVLAQLPTWFSDCNENALIRLRFEITKGIFEDSTDGSIDGVRS